MMFEDPAIQSVLDMIDAMTPDQKTQLIKDTACNTALFCEIVFPHVMISEFHGKHPEKINAFLAGNLDRIEYMPKVHVDMYDGHDGLFNGDYDNLVEVCGRGLAKTTIKNLCNVKNICYNFFDVVGFISETKDQAAQDLNTIWDEIENNPIIHKLFGKFILTKNNEYKKIFIHPIYKTEIVYIATGMNGRIRGMNYKKKRPKLVCVDDFESEANSLTPQGREKVQRTINSKIINLGGHALWKMAFYGTIVHHETFLAKARTLPFFQNPTGKYIECALSTSPSIVFDPNKERNIVLSSRNFQIGTPAWPQRYNESWIRAKMTYFLNYNGGTEFWQFLQEFYNIPKTDSDPVFDVDMLKEIDATFNRYDDLSYLVLNEPDPVIGQDLENTLTANSQPFKPSKKIPVMLFSGIDPAAGRELRNDRTVAMTIAVTPAGKIVIVDIDANRMSYEEQRECAVNIYKRYKPQKIAIESFGYQLSFYDSTVDLFRKRGLYASFKKYNRTNLSKSNKFKQYLIPLINSGQIMYAKGCRNIDMFIREIAAYSFEIEHDDTIDALFLCIYAAGNIKPQAISIDDAIRGIARNKSVFSSMRSGAVAKDAFATDFMKF